MRFPLMFRSTHEKALRISEARTQFWRDRYDQMEAAFLKASKNDMLHDPKTGRFVKKV